MVPTLFHEHDLVQLMYETIEAVLLESDKLSPQRRKKLIAAHLAIQHQYALRAKYGPAITGQPNPDKIYHLLNEVTEERVDPDPETQEVVVQQRVAGVEVYLPHLVTAEQMQSNLDAIELMAKTLQEQKEEA